MKRISLLTVALLFACLSFAQMTRLSETEVKSPKFNGSSSWINSDDDNRSPICQYLQKNLDANYTFKEGVVAVLFTINEDGTLSNLSLENSVSTEIDNMVLHCIQSTSGNWTPGKVNGVATNMQRKLFVSFYNPDNGTLKEQANNSLQLAIKKYNAAVNIKSDVKFTQQVAAKKANNRLQTAISLLDKAERFSPSEPAVVFWQAATYEQIGDEMLKNEKLNEFLHLIDPAYQAQIELVDIAL